MDNAYFAASRSSVALAQTDTDYNRKLLTEWLPFVEEQLAEGRNAEQIVSAIKKEVVKSKARIRAIVHALIVLRRFPKVIGEAIKHGHIDVDRLIAMANKLRVVSDDARNEVDGACAAMLRPRVPSEAFVLAAALGNRIRKIILMHQAEPLAPPEKKPTGSVRIDERQRFRFAFSFDDIEGAFIHKGLRAFMRKHACDLAEAFRRLVAGEQKAKAHLNLYVSPDGVAYLPEVGWLSPAQAKKLLVTKVKPMSTAESDTYGPPATMRAFVKGRDGSCRYPGCSVDAEHCQIDHVIPHGEGGATSPRNLHCLCQHHHNMKTRNQVSVTIDAAGVDTWILHDGEEVVTFPEGPLATVPTPRS